MSSSFLFSQPATAVASAAARATDPNVRNIADPFRLPARGKSAIET
jgi:hypothetical protein